MLQIEDKLDEVRTICRLYGCPTGHWEDLADLPLRLSQDAGFRSYFTEIVRSLQASGVPLPDALELVIRAVGGDSALKHTHQLSEQLSLLTGFLGSIGRWPGDDARPILAPGEVPENIHQFTRPQPRNPAPRPAPAPAPDDQKSKQQPDPKLHPPPVRPAEVTASQPAEHPTPPANLPPLPPTSEPPDQPALPESHAPLPIDDIARALARLERGNLELRAHLDSIDQRISRMEPLLESSTPAEATPAPEPAPPIPDPHAAPILIHRHPPSSKSTRINLAPTPSLEPVHSNPQRVLLNPQPVIPAGGAAAVEGPASPAQEPPSIASKPKSAAPTPFAPRFSRFTGEPDALPPDPAPAHSPGPAPSYLRPVPLPIGFFGTATTPENDAPNASNLEKDPPLRSRSRHFALVATVLILFSLIGGAFLLYTRSISTGDDAANSISPVAAPAAGNGPLSDTPAGSAPAAQSPGNAAPRVLSARSAFQPRQASEVPGSSSGFRPASTFVPASVMEGHLLSAPPPDISRVPSSARAGVVVMEANISSSGQVEDLHVLGGGSALRTSAIEAVRNWQYKPYLLNGSPVEVRTIIRVDFSQHHAQAAERTSPFPP